MLYFLLIPLRLKLGAAKLRQALLRQMKSILKLFKTLGPIISRVYLKQFMWGKKVKITELKRLLLVGKVSKDVSKGHT